MSLLRRYCNGDCEQVWQEIIERKLPPEADDVIDIATETVLRAKRNLCLLYRRLCEVGFEFAEPDQAFVETTSENAAPLIATVESTLGKLPLLARIWYQHIASVNFAQSQKQCSRQSGSELANLGWYPKLIYLGLPRCLELAAQKKHEYREWFEANRSIIAEHGMEGTHPDDVEPFLPLGGVASNCEPKGFKLPCTTPDAEFFNDGDIEYFNADIRNSIALAGFPALNTDFYRSGPEIFRLKHPDPDQLHQFLTADFEPL